MNDSCKTKEIYMWLLVDVCKHLQYILCESSGSSCICFPGKWLWLQPLRIWNSGGCKVALCGSWADHTWGGKRKKDGNHCSFIGSLLNFTIQTFILPHLSTISLKLPEKKFKITIAVASIRVIESYMDPGSGLIQYQDPDQLLISPKTVTLFSNRPWMNFTCIQDQDPNQFQISLKIVIYFLD